MIRAFLERLRPQPPRDLTADAIALSGDARLAAVLNGFPHSTTDSAGKEQGVA